MVLGCFPLKGKKKRGSVSMKRLDLEESSKPIALPEPPPKVPSRNLQSAPPSFRTRAKTSNVEMSSSRTRVMSAPSSIHGVAERDLLSHEEQETSPQPLPLPSPRTGSSLKNWGSFKSFNGSSGRLSSSAVSGPLPLPPSVSVRSFSYDEVVSACSAFATDRCVSEGLSSVMYMASFGDEASTSSLKNVEATVVRLNVITQVNKTYFVMLQYIVFVCALTIRYYCAEY